MDETTRYAVLDECYQVFYTRAWRKGINHGQNVTAPNLDLYPRCLMSSEFSNADIPRDPKISSGKCYHYSRTMSKLRWPVFLVKGFRGQCGSCGYLEWVCDTIVPYMNIVPFRNLYPNGKASSELNESIWSLWMPNLRFCSQFLIAM